MFCGAGGASMGYHRAFPDAHIVGVDHVDQPNYPFEFVKGDVALFEWEDIAQFDLIHASPPCHDFTSAGGKRRNRDGGYGTGWLLWHTIDLLAGLDVPVVVENVVGAPMPKTNTIRLCGSSFGLDLRRHRLFWSNKPLAAPPCDHAWQKPRFPSLRNNIRKEGRLSPVVGVHGHAQYPGDFAERCRAMEIDWMTLDELNESIPPAFTEWIGKALCG
jgi:DNA (cytosine-5)-methyltransferase 1